MQHQAVTANRLRDGKVVYLGHDGRWSERLGEARLASGEPEAAALLSIAERAVQARLVVQPYLFTLSLEAGVVRPLSQRELIRAKGPSVRPDLGPRAGGG